uniref:Uncharacterized protein n=1 Tax=Meloidogyne floridensis TaxID=298350 RepID=A0A915NZL6_9BILA
MFIQHLQRLGRIFIIFKISLILIINTCMVLVVATEVDKVQSENKYLDQSQNEKNNHQNSNILLPFSLYEKMLLAKALDEHRAVELDEENFNKLKENKKEFPKFPKEEIDNEEINKTKIIIYLPPPPLKYPQVLEKTLRRKGEKVESNNKEGLEQQRRRRPNPQLMLFKSHSSEQYAWKNKNNKNEEKYEKLNNNKQINTTKKPNKNKKETFSMSSDEHYTINRPITILNPPPITTTNNLNKEIALTKQMIPFAVEPPPSPIIASNNLENMRGSQVPFIVPNDANNQNDFASKLLGQLFPLNGGGDNNNKLISPRMAAAPLAGSPFDLFSNGGGLAAAGQSATPNPLLQMLTQGSTLEQITTLTRN